MRHQRQKEIRERDEGQSQQLTVERIVPQLGAPLEPMLFKQFYEFLNAQKRDLAVQTRWFNSSCRIAGRSADSLKKSKEV